MKRGATVIDLIINEEGGVTLAHSIRALDAYDALDLSMTDGVATLCGPEGRRGVGTLAAAMLDMLRPGMRGRSIRVRGWSIARVSPLRVETLH